MDNSQAQNTATQIPTPCSPPSPTQFDQAFTEFGNTLAPILKAAATTQTNLSKFADTKRDTVCASRNISRYIYKGIKEYTLFNTCITISTTKDAEELVNTTKETIDKNNKLGTAYKAAVDSIKAAKQKIDQQVKNLTDKLNADVPNSCNSEEVKQIKASLGNGGNKKTLEASIAELTTYALKITESVDDVSESAVKVAGINAFINVQSLGDASAIIKTGADSFVKDVDANIKSLQGDYEAAKKDLADSQKLFTTATLQKYKAIASKQALDWVKKLVENPECHKCGDSNELNELAQKAAQSFNESCADTTSVETAEDESEE